MDYAICTENSVTYEAVQFSHLPSAELARKRRLLKCTECGAPAFFRRESRSGRAACFGARPHEEGCELAALDHPEPQDGQADDENQLNNPGERIVVDLNFGANEQAAPEVDPNDQGSGNRGRRFVGGGARPNARMQRRLSSLLRTLLHVPTFSQSTQILEFEGRNDIAVRDFFVPVANVTEDHCSLFRGFWGMLSDARAGSDGTLWLNGGGRDDISFCLNQEHVGEVYSRYNINDEEDLAGANVLVIGTLRISQRDKMYCSIADPEHLTVRLG